MSSKKNKEELTNKDFFISGTPSNKINTINRGVKKTPPARIQVPSNKVIKRTPTPKQSIKRTPTPKQSIKRTPTPKQSIKRTPTPKKQTIKRTPTPTKQTIKRTSTPKQTIKRTPTPTKQTIKRTPTTTKQTVKREIGQTKPKFSLKIKTKSKTKTKTKMNNDKKNTILITNGFTKKINTQPPGVKKNVTKGLSYLYANQRLLSNAYFKTNGPKFNNQNNLNSYLNKRINILSSNKQHLSFKYPTVDLTSKNKDFDINLLFLFYLDMIHDGTITEKKTTFRTFLNGDIKKIIYGEDVIDFRITTMMKKIIEIVVKPQKSSIKIINNNDVIAEKLQGGFESILKLHLDEIFDKKWTKTISTSSTDFKYNKKLYISLDSERKDDRASGSPGIISRLLDKSKNSQERYIKRFETVGSITDPGKYMVQAGIKDNIMKLTSKQYERSSSKWCLQLMTFNINDKMEIKLGFDEKNRNYTLHVNEYEVPIGMESTTARGTKNVKIKISKLLGDFIQVLYNVSLMKEYIKSNRTPITDYFCLGTTDSNLSLVYAFMVHEILNYKPKIIIDSHKNNNVILYNLDNHITPKSPNSARTNQTEWGLRTAGKSTVQQTKKRSRIPTSAKMLSPIAEGSNNKNNKNQPTKKQEGIFASIAKKFKFK